MLLHGMINLGVKILVILFEVGSDVIGDYDTVALLQVCSDFLGHA